MIGAVQRVLAGNAYDLWFAASEAAGLSDLRRRHLAPAIGATLEVGSGTGLNLAHFPATVTELTLTEPDRTMAHRLAARRSQTALTTRLLRVRGESLPFADRSFDTVVSTFALCTVDDPQRTLAEARRVLRPGGTLLFLEHVRSKNVRLRRWQDRLAPAWRVVSVGCRCNQDTLSLLRSARFEIIRLDEGNLPKAPPLWRPYVVGEAVAR